LSAAGALGAGGEINKKGLLIIIGIILKVTSLQKKNRSMK